MNRDQYLAALKVAAVSIGKKAVMSRLAAEMPKLFLGLAGNFFNPVIGALVERVLNYAIKEGELGAFFLFIDMRIGKQAKDFEAAALEHYLAQQSGNPEEVKRAEERLKKEFAAFVLLSS